MASRPRTPDTCSHDERSPRRSHRCRDAGRLCRWAADGCGAGRGRVAPGGRRGRLRAARRGHARAGCARRRGDGDRGASELEMEVDGGRSCRSRCVTARGAADAVPVAGGYADRCTRGRGRRRALYRAAIDRRFSRRGGAIGHARIRGSDEGSRRSSVSEPGVARRRCPRGKAIARGPNRAQPARMGCRTPAARVARSSD
jgi:hypothetical protein